MSGSGKSTVAGVFTSLGATVIDCDALAHEALLDDGVKASLADAFGEDILKNGDIDRKLLAALAFSNAASTQKLNSLTHPYILRRMNEELAASDGVCVIDAPLLFNCGLDSLCDVTVAVVSTRERLIRRIIKRDGISRSDAKARLERQADMPALLQKADVTIENNGITEDKLKKLAANIYGELINNDSK